MQATLTSVSNPKWANEEKTIIDCVITTSQFGERPLPFSATSYDSEPHGRQIFADLAAGKYGVVADFVPPENKNQ